MKKLLILILLLALYRTAVYSQHNSPLKEFAERFHDLYLKKNLVELDKTHPYDTKIRLIVKTYKYKKYEYTLQVEFFRTYKELSGWLSEKKLWGLETPPKLFCYKEGIIFFEGDTGMSKVLCSKHQGRYYVDTIIMKFFVRE